MTYYILKNYRIERKLYVDYEHNALSDFFQYLEKFTNRDYTTPLNSKSLYAELVGGVVYEVISKDDYENSFWDVQNTHMQAA